MKRNVSLLIAILLTCAAEVSSADAPRLNIVVMLVDDPRQKEDSDALFRYIWQHYESMVRFYEAAANDGDAMLLHLA